MRLIAIVFVALLVSACSTPPNGIGGYMVKNCKDRPATGPGSGCGSDYVPAVEPTTVAPETYAASVTKCQRWARELPFPGEPEHDAALATIAFGAGWAIGVGPMALAAQVAAVGVGTTGHIAMHRWVHDSQTQAWFESQETLMMNCMTRDGYVNIDPSVKLTWAKPNAQAVEVRATGRDTYNAEKFAKAASCSATPLAALVQRGPGFETYSVPCSGGQTLTVRCEFGNCRDTQPIVATNDKAPSRVSKAN
ncbi:hypothetical protein AB4Z46_30000 [Variovorax sp. M-6]|uniref:hypothetical protein n=1 Tax=Variovorax sp. M-6 TaxID=3233041 RepID=UPI003F9E45A4